MKTKSTKKLLPKENYIIVTKRRWHDEGVIEIDDTARISRGRDSGAYVQAWVWVSDDDAKGERKII